MGRNKFRNCLLDLIARLEQNSLQRQEWPHHKGLSHMTTIKWTIMVGLVTFWRTDIFPKTFHQQSHQNKMFSWKSFGKMSFGQLADDLIDLWGRLKAPPPERSFRVSSIEWGRESPNHFCSTSSPSPTSVFLLTFSGSTNPTWPWGSRAGPFPSRLSCSSWTSLLSVATCRRASTIYADAAFSLCARLIRSPLS